MPGHRRCAAAHRAGFDRELAALAGMRERVDFQPMIDQGVPATDLLLLAETVARGRWAYANGRYGEAARHYRGAAAIETKIPYMEPPYWYYPVHQSLGAALLKAGKPGEAADAFNAALARSPKNGWALHGLAAASGRRGAPNRRGGAGGTEARLDRRSRWLKMERL